MKLKSSGMKVNGGVDMDFNLTKESMELLIEEIVNAVESTDNRDEQFEAVRSVLTDNGIYEIKEE